MAVKELKKLLLKGKSNLKKENKIIIADWYSVTVKNIGSSLMKKGGRIGLSIEPLFYDSCLKEEF